MGRRVQSEKERERARVRAREWYADPANKAKRVEYAKARKAADPEAHAAAYREYSRAWRERNPEKRRLVWMKHKYRLTEEQAKELVANRGLCDSCGVEKANHIDHDHVTGAFRGQLCPGCNVAAGYLQDDPARASALAAYLIRTTPPRALPEISDSPPDLATQP